MNEERIRELAYKTKLKTGAPLGSEKWQKIFVELIIRECMFAIEEDAKFMHVHCPIEAIISLQKHFGLEK